MKKTAYLLCSLAILSLSNATWATGECKTTAYGAGVDLDESVAVSAILASPMDYDGKIVRVDGEVKDVCRMMGCWMEIQVANEENSMDVVKVKVKDGEIVFPVSTLGHQAAAQGTVEVKELSREDYIKDQEHLADEQDREFDASTVGEGPYRRIQILGTGAEVCAE